MSDDPWKLQGITRDLFTTNEFGTRRYKTESFIGSPLDSLSGSIKIIDTEHERSHAGKHYFVKDYADIPGSSSVDFLFVSNSEMPHMLFEFSSIYELSVIIYEDAVLSSNGSIVSVFNRNRNSPNICGCGVYVSPIVASTGTYIARYKSGDGKTSGGNIRASHEIIMKPNTNYLVRVSNLAVSTNTIDYLADWYEV